MKAGQNQHPSTARSLPCPRGFLPWESCLGLKASMVSRQVLQRQEPGCPDHPVPETTDRTSIHLVVQGAVHHRVNVSSAIGDVAPYLSVFVRIAQPNLHATTRECNPLLSSSSPHARQTVEALRGLVSLRGVYEQG